MTTRAYRANARQAVATARVPIGRRPNRPPEMVAALDALAVQVAKDWGEEKPRPVHWRSAAGHLGGQMWGKWEGHPTLVFYPASLSRQDARRWAGYVKPACTRSPRERLAVEPGIRRTTTWPAAGPRIRWEAEAGPSSATFPSLAQARGWRVLALQALGRGEVPGAVISRTRRGEAAILAAAPGLPEPILPEPVHPCPPAAPVRRIDPALLAVWEARFPGRPFPG